MRRSLIAVVCLPALGTATLAQRRPPPPQLSPIELMRADFATQSGGSTVYFGLWRDSIKSAGASGPGRAGPLDSASIRTWSSGSKAMPTAAIRATTHWRSARGAHRKCATISSCWGFPRLQVSAMSWGKEHPGPGRATTILVRNKLRRRGAGCYCAPASARAWRCASAISRAASRRDFGAALLAAGAARQSRQVEPFVRFDEVDLYAAAAGRINHAQIEQGVDVAAFCIGEPAPDQELRAFSLIAPISFPLNTFVSRVKFGPDGKEMVNAEKPCSDGEIVDQPGAADRPPPRSGASRPSLSSGSSVTASTRAR